MPFAQYHEPVEELSEEIRSFSRIIVSLGEEADAINWYEQRISVEKDLDAKKIMGNAQGEEFKHFLMDLEWLLRKKPTWRKLAKEIVLKDGDILSNAEEAEERIVHGG